MYINKKVNKCVSFLYELLFTCKQKANKYNKLYRYDYVVLIPCLSAIISTIFFLTNHDFSWSFIIIIDHCKWYFYYVHTSSQRNHHSVMHSRCWLLIVAPSRIYTVQDTDPINLSLYQSNPQDSLSNSKWCTCLITYVVSK